MAELGVQLVRGSAKVLGPLYAENVIGSINKVRVVSTASGKLYLTGTTGTTNKQEIKVLSNLYIQNDVLTGNGSGLTNLGGANIVDGTIASSKLQSSITIGTLTVSNGATISSGGLTATGNVTINGNLTVTGDTTTVSSSNLTISDKLLELGKREGNHALSGLAGIYVANYDGENSGLLAFDANGYGYIGDATITNGEVTDTSHLQKLATITMSQNGMVKYDNTLKTLVAATVGTDVIDKTTLDSTLAYYLTIANAESTYQPIGPYLTSIDSAMVVAALGFTPVSTTNFTETLTHYLTTTNAASTYVAITGFKENYLDANDVAYINDIPTKTSDLTNDGPDGEHPYLTEHQSLSSYYTKTESDARFQPVGAYLTSVPLATISASGGMKLGFTSSNADERAVQLDNSGRAYVDIHTTPDTLSVTLSTTVGKLTWNNSDISLVSTGGKYGMVKLIQTSTTEKETDSVLSVNGLHSYLNLNYMRLVADAISDHVISAQTVSLPTTFGENKLLVNNIKNSDGTLAYTLPSASGTLALVSDIPALEIFWCTYGTTTGQEIAAAIAAGKYVVCKYEGNIYGEVMLHSDEARYYLSGFYGSYTRLYVRCSATGATWEKGQRAFQGTADRVNVVNAESDNSHYPTAKAVWDKVSIIPSLTSRIETLEAKVTKLEDKAISISSFTGGGIYEIGTTIETVSLVWILSETPTAITLKENTTALDVDVADRSKSLTGKSITTDTIYTLTVDGEYEDSDVLTTSILFKNKVYWGTSASTTLNNAGVLALANSELKDNFHGTYEVNCAEDYYVYFAFPTSFGTPVFLYGGIPGGFSKVATIASFTNSSGHTSSYDVYRSTNEGLGSFKFRVR